MKIRNGFVSNSSSSSFLIVGVGDKQIIKQLSSFTRQKYKKMNEEDRDWYSDYGVIYATPFNFYGGYKLEDCYLSGIPIEELMKTMTLPEIKAYFKELVKKEYDMDIDISKIGVHYGEVCND